MNKETSFHNTDWFRLDNAAKIFPGQNTGTWSNIFRVCVEFKQKIDPLILEQALSDVLPRFPCFDVRIRSGFFWHYFERNPAKLPPIMPDISNPCHRVKFNENKRYLFRIYYHENRLSVDIYHALTDGYGNTVFICTLAAQYLRLCGETIPAGGFVLDINECAKPEELEDSFIANASSTGKVKRSDKFVYHAKGTKLPRHMVNITSGIIPFDKLHAITKSLGVTVTEYLAAVLLEVHYKKQLRENRKQKEVSVQIPVNLRKEFGSQTLRNFTLCLRVKIDPNLGEYTFEEILRQVSLQLRLVNNRKVLNAMMTANLGFERNPVLRAMPLVIKNAGIAISFLITGEQTTTALLSNLGAVTLPAEMEPFIEKVVLMAGPGKLNGARCGVSTYNNKLVFTFANIYRESDIERDFFTSLVKKGIPVKIESNRE